MDRKCIALDSEYEPQNTELVNVLAGKSMNFDIMSSHSGSDSVKNVQDDDNQNWADCIDTQLQSLPIKLYIETLVTTTRNNDKFIFAYTCRKILLSRASSQLSVSKRDIDIPQDNK